MTQQGGIGQRADGTLVLCGLGYGPATSDIPLSGDCSAINAPTIAELRPSQGVSLHPALTKAMSITGTYKGNGVILVASSQPASRPAADDDATPCPTPRHGRPAVSDDTALSDHVNQHLEHFLPLRYTDPSADPSVKVATIGTTADLDTIRADLTSLYSGPLCVYRLPRSQTDLTTAHDQALAILQRDHISLVPELAGEIGTEPTTDYTTTTIPITVALLTQQAAKELAPLADSITLTVSIRPAPHR